MIIRKLPKKERELIMLKEFINNEALGLPVLDIEESETPDFIVHSLKKRKISVELTQLIHPSLIEKEVFREKIVDMAHELFKQKYNCELYVLVTFSSTPIKSKANEINQYAESLFKQIESIYLPNKNYEFHVSTKRVKNNSHIEWLSVSNNRDLENWQSFGAFLVEEIDVDWVKKKIIEKEKMISRYTGNFDEN